MSDETVRAEGTVAAVGSGSAALHVLLDDEGQAVYVLKREGGLSDYEGKRVEVTGTLEPGSGDEDPAVLVVGDIARTGT
jgi:hypothetical protein